MLTAGVVIAACLVAALTLFALLRVRNVGWGGILLGLAGLVYSFVAYPDRVVLVVLPLSVLVILLGYAALVRRRQKASKHR
jgi:hypothetical protein